MRQLSSMVAVALVAFLVPSLAHADGDDLRTIALNIDHGSAEAKKRSPQALSRDPGDLPLSISLGLSDIPFEPALTLPELGAAEFERIQQASAGSGYPYAIIRHTFAPASLARIVQLDHGWSILVMDIRSSGALCVRLHLSAVNLPSGAVLQTYNPSDQSWVDGPVCGAGPSDTGEFWSVDFPGQDVRVECLLPPGADGTFAPAPSFFVADVGHGFRDTFGQSDGARGGCRIDIACDPSWTEIGDGVGRLCFILPDNMCYYCTGQLIRTESDDQTPYFLTAAHCTEGAVFGYDATYILWRFQAPTCGGQPPMTTPRSKYLDLLALNSNRGYALFMIDGVVFRDLHWCEWTTSTGSAGNDVVCIHHPSGTRKCISYGVKQGSPVACANPAFAFRVDWTEGSTEGGSSGGGLFRADDRRLIGLDECEGVTGCESCCPATVFSAFDSIYAEIHDYLDYGEEDPFEALDSCNPSPLIPESFGGDVGLVENLIVKVDDEDWFVFELEPYETLQIATLFKDNRGNIDIQLFSNCSPIASSTGTTDGEFIEFTNTGPTAKYWLRVFLADDTRAGYALTWIKQRIMNDSCSSAFRVYPGLYYGDNSNFTADGSACILEPAGEIRDAWYRFVAEEDGTLIVRVCGCPFDAIVSIFDHCPPGNVELACSSNCDEGACSDSLAACIEHFAVTEGTEYIIRVDGLYPHVPGAGAFELQVDFVALGPTNDDWDDAADTGAISTIPGTTNGATPDGGPSCGNVAQSPDVWYSYTAECDGLATFGLCDADFDTVLVVYAPAIPLPANILVCNDDNCNTGSVATLEVTRGTKYLLRISGYDGDRGDFVLDITLSESAPQNDMCSAATVIGNGVIVFDNFCATTDGPSEPTCDARMDPQIASDIWFSYTATCTGTATISLCGTFFDSELAVYGGSCLTGLGEALVCSDDSCDMASEVSLDVTAMQTYLIRVGGYAGAEGSGSLSIECDGCTADFDMSGEVGVPDIFTFLSAWFAGLPSADFDGSGPPPAVPDIFAFLSAWFAGC